MIYEIHAISKDKQQYTLRLKTQPNKIQEEFRKHINKKGWTQFEYKIVAWKQVHD